MERLEYDVLLFDLDGTLTASAPGMLGGVHHVCREMGLEIPPDDILQQFIGPPMTTCFSVHFGLEGEALAQATRSYRAYYDRQGWMENGVFDGIFHMLTELRACGKRLGVATNKSMQDMTKITEHFGLAPYFDFMSGSDKAVGRQGKANVIAYALENLGVRDNSRVVMIGDRKYDVEGAAEKGIAAIGVAYGYGSRAELRNAGAIHVVETPMELCAILK